MATRNNGDVTGWVGWVYFAGFMMLVMGIFQMIAGFTALLNDTYFLVREGSLIALDYTQWGWVHLLLGLVVMLAGVAVTSGKVWGRVVGVLLAMASLIANFAFLEAYPIWSLVVIVVDILIIYALTVHGAEAEV